MGFTAMGDYDGIDESSGMNDSPIIENKTNKSSNNADPKETQFQAESKQKVIQSLESNVLNSYRSITYNFTLSALKNLEVNEPDTYRDSELDLVILKSGGKGTTGVAAPSSLSSAQTKDIEEPVYDKFSAQNNRRKAKTTLAGNQDIVAGFNKNSPGRFDMFIENVEIETLMAFSENSNASLPCKIQFEIIEPYSVNGFIEALHVTAISAGYPNYLSACFLLKMEFWGYSDRDDENFLDPVQIKSATRYFPIGLTGIDVDITEKGTRYKVSAVPYNERAFGQPNVVKKPIKMAGTTVKEILENLMENINNQVSRMDKDGRSDADSKLSDEYAVKFVNWSESDGWVEAPNGENKISKSKLTDLHRENNLYKMADPGTSQKPDAYKKNGVAQPSAQDQAKQPESIKYTPGQTVIQSAEGMNIHDIITSVIRDCEYMRDILKNIKTRIDEFGMVEYFMVRIEVTNLDVIDTVSKKPYQKFTYIVSPYRIHYTRIPPHGSAQVKESELSKKSLREYNYIYTGKNVDVLNFKLNFNTLFFEAIPAALGNKDIPSSKTGTGPSNDPEAAVSGSEVGRQQANQVPLTPTKVSNSPTQYTGANAAQPLDDPYSVLARNMHESIINSKASMITGEIEILGDPLYVATNGVGNYNAKPAGQGKLVNGEANHLYGDVFVTINFRNPIDILDLERGGGMEFDSNRVPFSGVYRVIKAISTFKEGKFGQRLEIIRVPGQILDHNIRPTDPSQTVTNTESPDDTTLPNTTRANPEIRPSVDQINRAFPGGNLPGEFANVPIAPGNLAGDATALMNRTYGLVSKNGALMTNSSPIGQILPTDVASNIRLSSSGLASLGQPKLGNAALFAVASNVISGNLPAQRAFGVLTGGVIGNALQSALKKSNEGSGIGEGASMSITGKVVNPVNATAIEVLSGQTISDTKLTDISVNNLSQSLTTLKTSAMNVLKNTTQNVGQFASDVGDKISKLTASPVDPAGTAASLGINTAALSGLSTLPSKVFSQLSNLVDNTPSNVNLKQAVDSGLLLQNIPANKIKNIPATQPFSKAPDPIIETSYVKQVVDSGGVKGLENLYGVNDFRKLSSNIVPADIINSAIATAPNSSFNPLSSAIASNRIDANVLKDKLQSASQLIGSPGMLDKNILGSVGSKFGSSSIGSSPLDKLVNKLNDPSAPPYTGNDPIIRKRLGMPPLE